ncbi:PKD-like family lipoprotein [Sphingobacterium faecale]|uniref:PKD family protein n=1 Tax=Sphingobacterium faecale TaxID=2803775 RepID=A0ABS1R791_9SPHI|nr:PKD-like family lipoprotein [Sphingobacterium faecale]MBL1410586.1 hypothetical protein [Sphingobacterium faecale]
MKTIKILITLMLSVLFYSCNKELENSRLDEREDITIKGLESHYSVVSGLDTLIIDPVSSSNKEADFEYLWGIYEINTQGKNPVMDTIGRNRKIVYPVNKTAKDWFLSLRVKNKKTGYSAYFKSTVEVATEYTRGWYVLKQEADETDMDFFTTPNSIFPDHKVENVYSLVNGSKLKGRAIMIRFFNDFKAPADGTYANTRSLCVVTDKEVGIVNLSNLNIIKNFNTLFHGEPARANMQMIGNDFLSYYLVNDGQLHSLIAQGPSTGTFGGRKIKGTQDAPYFLSPYHLMNTASSFFFDELSSSFFAGNNRNMNLLPVGDFPGSTLSANNNNKKLLYMGLKNTGPFHGYAIFEDKTDPSNKSIAQINPMGNQLRITNTTINPHEKLYNGINYTLVFQDEDIMYFSLGKEIWSRNLTNKIERLQYTVTGDEEITFIRHRKFSGTGPEAGYSYNYVMIGTKQGERYKIRMFNKASGNLLPDPVIIMEGKGRASDALFVGPAINYFSYPYTF